jgi:ABC-type lipoprotein export system ATPase subunit
VELIDLKDITKTYHLGEIDVPVLRGVTLSVARGSLVALMGASGSGKSTLMNILGCLDRPSGGSYWLDGEEISRLNADRRARLRNRKLGFVFQSFNLLARTSALENVAMPLAYSDDAPTEREGRRRAEELLQLVGLGDRVRHVPSQLSGGQQQRVAIARALVNRPAVLLADEPTGNLDSRTSAEVLAIFERLHTEQGLTILLVTHDPEVALHAQRVIRIHDGLVVGEEEAQAAPAGGEAGNGGGA